MSLPTKSAELSTLHRQWLTYAVTQQLGRVLDKHSERIIESICTTASSLEDGADMRLRVLAVQLQKVRTLKHAILDTETFIAQLE